jgi:RND family efflux transporter MFP subunit
VLVELTNPDVMLQSLEAERSLAAAEATLASQRTALESQRLVQVGARASARSALAAARRDVVVMEALDRKGLAAPFELAAAHDRLREHLERDSSEARRLALITVSATEELSLQRGQVERLRAITRFHHDRMASMHVEAGEAGVLQEIPLELGQWVTPGMILARIAREGGLKASLRVSETQAKDLIVGQRVVVDTRNGVVVGRLARIDPRVQQGSVLVDVTLPPELPRGVRAAQSVEGTIELERREGVLSVGRPAYGQSGGTSWVFRVSGDGGMATRRAVRLGAASAQAIEVLDGLEVGDRVVVSDMSPYEHLPTIRLR